MGKCDKYEAYFLFANDADFKKHLSECEDCQSENEKYKKISALVKEAKPAYERNQRQKLMTKVACISAMMMFTLSFGLLDQINYDKYETAAYSEDTILDEMGMPIDNYGLLMVD